MPKATRMPDKKAMLLSSSDLSSCASMPLVAHARASCSQPLHAGCKAKGPGTECCSCSSSHDEQLGVAALHTTGASRCSQASCDDSAHQPSSATALAHHIIACGVDVASPQHASVGQDAVLYVLRTPPGQQRPARDAEARSPAIGPCTGSSRPLSPRSAVSRSTAPERCPFTHRRCVARRCSACVH